MKVKAVWNSALYTITKRESLASNRRERFCFCSPAWPKWSQSKTSTIKTYVEIMTIVGFYSEVLVVLNSTNYCPLLVIAKKWHFFNYDVCNFVSCMTTAGTSLFQATYVARWLVSKTRPRIQNSSESGKCFVPTSHGTYEMKIKQRNKFKFHFYLRGFVLAFSFSELVMDSFKLKPFPCTVCRKWFKIDNGRTSHKRAVHSWEAS